MLAFTRMVITVISYKPKLNRLNHKQHQTLPLYTYCNNSIE